VQDVEFVDDHVIVDDLPKLTFDWLNVSVTVGAGVTGVVGVFGVDGAEGPPPPPPHPVNIMSAAIASIPFFFIWIFLLE